jgi:hypothetical protein
MSYILRRLPIDPNPVRFRNEVCRVRSPQIIVWVSLNVRSSEEWDPRLPRFPAILDTGNSHSFFIRESHLIQWAGIRPAAMRELGSAVSTGVPVKLRHGCLFLHRNLPGLRDKDSGRPPVLLSTREGISVCSDSHPRAPRLPLLGLRALTANKLTLIVDGARNEVSLRTAAR